MERTETPEAVTLSGQGEIFRCHIDNRNSRLYLFQNRFRIFRHTLPTIRRLVTGTCMPSCKDLFPNSWFNSFTHSEEPIYFRLRMKLALPQSRAPVGFKFPRFLIGQNGWPKGVCRTLQRSGCIHTASLLVEKDTIVVLLFNKAYIRDTTHRYFSAIALEKFVG